MNIYLAHFMIDTLGGLVMLYARSFCQHAWHKAIVWFTLSVLVTVVTVHSIG